GPEADDAGRRRALSRDPQGGARDRPGAAPPRRDAATAEAVRAALVQRLAHAGRRETLLHSQQPEVMVAARRSASLATWRQRAVRDMTASRREMLSFVNRLPEAEVLHPRTIGDWSVKDVLGHLLACDEETARRFRLIARGRGDRIHWFESMADADRFNA